MNHTIFEILIGWSVAMVIELSVVYFFVNLTRNK